jgi:hypothetical protein
LAHAERERADTTPQLFRRHLKAQATCSLARWQQAQLSVGERVGVGRELIDERALDAEQ